MALRILTVLTCDRPHWTGLTAHAAVLAEGLVARGHQVTVVTTRHDGGLRPTEDLNGVRVVRCRAAATAWPAPRRSALSSLGRWNVAGTGARDTPDVRQWLIVIALALAWNTKLNALFIVGAIGLWPVVRYVTGGRAGTIPAIRWPPWTTMAAAARPLRDSLRQRLHVEPPHLVVLPLFGVAMWTRSRSTEAHVSPP